MIIKDAVRGKKNMIAIVDYGAGNLTSVLRAISFLGFDSVITDKPEEIIKADRIIFPGVGAAGSAMEGMKIRGIDTVMEKAFEKSIPMLGICVGSQIIMDKSEENNTACLGFIPGEVKAFLKRMKMEHERFLKVPHMGWNSLTIVQDHPLLTGIHKEDEFYFVHSYYPVPKKKENIFGTTEYGITFAAAIGKNNLFATQFHLEKSGEPGLLILKNFCVWEPC